MRTFSLEDAGKFRANPNASIKNNLRIVADTEGTPQNDSGTVDVSAATEITGVKYTGASGVEAEFNFNNEEIPDGRADNYRLLASASADDLKQAILSVIEKHEVAPVVTVTKAGNVFTINHYGSGTLNSIVVDGSDEVLSRSAISAVEVQVEAEEVEVKAESKKVSKKAVTK